MSDEALEATFDGVIAGRSDLKPFQTDIARLLAQLLLSSKSMSDASELTALASDVAKLEALLPPVVTDDPGEMDLTRLSDDEINQLLCLQTKACGQAPPEPSELLQPVVEHKEGERERLGKSFGVWLDQRVGAWIFGGVSEIEMAYMRNEITGLIYPAIGHALYRRIIEDELRDQIERGVARARSLGGSLRVVAPTPEERQQIEPPPAIEPPCINDGGVLGHYPPFSFPK